jgi:hypothetical protein
MKKKTLISRKVLQTELSIAIQYIDDHNFGYAKNVIHGVYNRVKEYDLIKPEPKPKETKKCPV